MQMNRVDVITRIAHANAVALALVQMEGRRRHHLLPGIRHAVDGPLIESVERGVLLFEDHVQHLVRLGGRDARIAKVGVIPLKDFGGSHCGLPLEPPYSTTMPMPW